MEYDRAFHLIDTRYGISLLVILRISAADEHHADGSTRVKLDGTLVEVTGSHTLKQIHDIALQTKHHTFCLGITHSTVVFDDVRLGFACRCVGTVDETEEDETLVVDVLCSQTLYGRTDDTVLHLLHPFFCGKGNRRDRAHTAGVQACVVLTDAFVVFCFRENLIMPTIREHEDRALNTTHKFLNDHSAGSIAKHTAQHLL